MVAPWVLVGSVPSNRMSGPFHEIHGLTEGHEGIGLQIQQTKGSAMVVEHQGIHVRGPKPSSSPEVPDRIDRFGHGKVAPVDDALVLGTRALGGRLHQGRGTGVPEAPGPIAAAPSFFWQMSSKWSGSATMRELRWSSRVIGSLRGARGLREAYPRNVTATQPKCWLVDSGSPAIAPAMFRGW